MIQRTATRTIKARLKQYPAVALVGPRQAGKTTLAQAIGGEYFDLEQESERLRLDLKWPSLKRQERLIILDEAQAAPEIFSRLRGAIDEERQRRGRFLLLGSVSPSLMTQVSESLAGRLSLMELTPFVLDEIPDAPVSELWLLGGYPDGGILDRSRFPGWQRDYLALLAQRDLPSWGLPAQPALIQRLLRMTAAVHGQLLNASGLGLSLGISYHTVDSYLDYLAGAFLVRRLYPYQTNLKKRLTRRPKLYWRDSGLLHALLNVSDEETLLSQPWVGASWEGFVIEQILAALRHSDTHCEPYYLRTNDEYEIDLVLDFGSTLWAMEIKLTTEPSSRDMARLEKIGGMIEADRLILISQTEKSYKEGRRISCNIRWLLDNLSGLLDTAKGHGGQ